MIRISFKTLSVGLIALACLLSAPAGADQITYDMVTVGNPGNANDTGGTFNGAVNYEYQIGKYHVTIGQYTAFLNAVAVTDTYSLYNANMATNPNTGAAPTRATRATRATFRGRLLRTRLRGFSFAFQLLIPLHVLWID